MTQPAPNASTPSPILVAASTEPASQCPFQVQPKAAEPSKALELPVNVDGITVTPIIAAIESTVNAIIILSSLFTYIIISPIL